MPRTINFQPHLDSIKSQFGTELNADMVKEYVSKNPDVSYQTITKYLNQWKVCRGKWNIQDPEKEIPTATFQATPTPTSTKLQKTQTESQNLVPDKDNTFIPFGNFPSLKKVIASREFYPTFITGMSGNGKTFGVEQACSQLGRELIRVNITVETDEDDLIGGFRLVNGQTVWHNGAVIEALERGAILLLDEIDLASNKILCLQPILEGKGIFLKKIGEYIKPAKGFNVIATANTKGKGSDDGRFIGTNVLNEAFLERFPITFEQEYPTAATENKILTKLCESLGIPMTGDHKQFISYLTDWADIVRRTFNDGGIDEIISTRRLVHIMRAYQIFGDKMKAMEMCLNRFDDETKTSFVQLYTKLDDKVNSKENDPLL
tara:strand:- start:149 stop:1276 length:1128 start_codon:yes stop_codon:yes gene_type:complete